MSVSCGILSGSRRDSRAVSYRCALSRGGVAWKIRSDVVKCWPERVPRYLLAPSKASAQGAERRPTPTLQLAPLHASPDRITAITVCTRPFRAQGPRLDVEQVGQKTVIHNYGHGGSGWSLSWGSSGIAVQKAMATGERDIAVIGCGALGLTSGLLLQRAGGHVTIYAKELPPNVRSSLATGLWTPDSRICFEEYATPAFKQLWESMARQSFRTYQTLLGLAGQSGRIHR